MLVSKRKRYLSGPDWVINALDRSMKASMGAGNLSQVVLLLNGPVDEHEVRDRLNGFVRLFPVLQGSVGRDLKLAPYWKIPATGAHDAALTVHRVDDQALAGDFLSLLEICANAPFLNDSDHLAFHLFTGRERCAFSMCFDHRIFDARGAELFLNLFQLSLANGAAEVRGDIAFTSSSALSQWSKKFLAGRNVNRRIMSMTRSSTPEALPVPDGKHGYRYRVIAFTEQETLRIYDRAYDEAGYLMESPYLLAVIMQSMHELLSLRSRPATTYRVPVTIDLRPGLDPLQEIFFNYVSYLFYQVPVHEVSDRRGLIAALKQQMYDQVKAGFPKDLAEASLLTRIAPLPLLGKLLHLPMKGKMATFAFSHLGKSSYQDPAFMGREIEALFHMPRVPAPPGIGFFSNYFNNRLNLVISYLDGMIDDLDVQRLEQGLRDRFCGGSA